jgi:hypothetical protein
MKKSLVAVLLMGLLVVATSNPAFGASKKKKAAPPQKHETKITSVTPSSVTITEDKATKTFAINQFTEITVNGQKAAITDLKPGMNVTVTLGTDPTKASRITASGKM